MIEVILIWIFCIIVIGVLPLIGIIAYVYISTNAPIEGWNIYENDLFDEKKDKRDGA